MSFFEALGPTKKEQVEEFEEIEGRFTCQERGCWEPTHEAMYFNDAKLLTWKCPKGHINKIEDFEI